MENKGDYLLAIKSWQTKPPIFIKIFNVAIELLMRTHSNQYFQEIWKKFSKLKNPKNINLVLIFLELFEMAESGRIPAETLESLEVQVKALKNMAMKKKAH